MTPAPRHPAREAQRGFTLLEVMIAMALLVVALAALLGHEAVAVQMSHYSNRVSQAALLAQGKLLDIEHQLKVDGMDTMDDCEQGDFRTEGFREYRWKACAYKVEFPDGAAEALVEDLMGMLGGLGIPGLDPEAIAKGNVGALGAAAGAAAAASGANAVQAAGQAQNVMGQVQMAIGAVPMFIQQLEDQVRKVKLEITWKDAIEDRVLLVERFVTLLGADPSNEPPPPDGEAEAVLQIP